MSKDEIEEGYRWAYKEFYKWNNIFKASFAHDSVKHIVKHLFYTGGWKKFERIWTLIINLGGLKGMLPLLELLLSDINGRGLRKGDTQAKEQKAVQFSLE